jgi:pantothenate kinase-related protein Tda10
MGIIAKNYDNQRKLLENIQNTAVTWLNERIYDINDIFHRIDELILFLNESENDTKEIKDFKLGLIDKIHTLFSKK